MRSLITVGLIGAASSRRVSPSESAVQIDPAHYADVSEYLHNQGYDQPTIHRVANFVSDKWPGDTTEQVSNRRMKAVQLLALEERARFWNASGHLKHLQASSFAERAMRDAEQPVCDNLWHPDNVGCKGDVEWAYWTGRWQPGGGETYFDIQEYAQTSLSAATLDDFQRLFYCGMGSPCGVPPCGCTNPPCHTCGTDDAVEDFDLGFEEQCSQHSACVGLSGDCCPDINGQMNDCCNVVPDIVPVGPPVFPQRPTLPGQEIQSPLHGGRYLGPLKNTKCRSPKTPSGYLDGQTLNQCANLCTNGHKCTAFTYLDGQCKLYVDCRTQGSGDATLLYVKNIEGMEPHLLPTRSVHGNDAHFFVIGDWGGASCPGHASMHYVHRQYQPGSERYDLDHNAQSLVADTMGALGDQVNPFLVVNAGDNFYWGGVMHESLGGQDVHDPVTFKQGFEDIYHHDSLKVPWLSIMGNHDYGGDGCFANARAQFDYTIKDLLHHNRWKMPSPYYRHRVDFDSNFSAEFFMLDTNVEDSNGGRHGGICAQEICHETLNTETTPRAECVQWFKDLWSAQKEWLPAAVANSTADWKILVAHHKPHGPIGTLFQSVADEFGVQLMIGSHTHEMAYYESWYGSAPLLVVGAGGGAQGNPGCGGALYCSGPTGYGFADISINEKQLEVKIHQHDSEVVLHQYICISGGSQDQPC